MPPRYVKATARMPVQRFHPAQCCKVVSMQAELHDNKTGRMVATLASHVRLKTCWVTAHVHDSVLFRVYFNNEKIAQAIDKEKMAFVTRVTHEPQWV